MSAVKAKDVKELHGIIHRWYQLLPRQPRPESEDRPDVFYIDEYEADFDQACLILNTIEHELTNMEKLTENGQAIFHISELLEDVALRMKKENVGTEQT